MVWVDPEDEAALVVGRGVPLEADARIKGAPRPTELGGEVSAADGWLAFMHPDQVTLVRLSEWA